jgi:hypothetical protein
MTEKASERSYNVIQMSQVRIFYFDLLFNKLSTLIAKECVIVYLRVMSHLPKIPLNV